MNDNHSRSTVLVPRGLLILLMAIGAWCVVIGGIGLVAAYAQWMGGW